MHPQNSGSSEGAVQVELISSKWNRKIMRVIRCNVRSMAGLNVVIAAGTKECSRLATFRL